MRFYGLSDTHVLDMPVSRFWFLYGCVFRIEAQEDIRRLNLQMTVAGMEPSADAINGMHASLRKDMGRVMEFDAYDGPDPDAKERLMALAAGF